MQQGNAKPLNDAELGRLEDFLEAIGTLAMNFEMLDGFFAAFICASDNIFLELFIF